MMSLPQWFQQLRSRQSSGLDARIARLELHYEKLAQAGTAENAEREQPPAVVIEHLNIEHVHIHKLEHSNNFGALGIKELGGKLNIGVNYSGPIEGEEFKELFPAAKKAASADPAPPVSDGAGSAMSRPAYNIRPKAL